MMINVPRICLILRYWMQAVWLWSRQLRIQQPTATGNYAAIGRFWSVPYRSSRSTKAQWSGRRLGDKVKIAGWKWIGRVENKREPPYVPPVVLTTGLDCTVLGWCSSTKFEILIEQNKLNYHPSQFRPVVQMKWILKSIFFCLQLLLLAPELQ